MTGSQNKKFDEITPEMNGLENALEDFNKSISSGKKVFLFLFMDGCGPCNETKPEWKKFQEQLKNKSHKNEAVVAVAVNQKLFDKLLGAGSEPMGYPCLRYINGKTIEEYEDANIENKDRSAGSFIKWVESKAARGMKQAGGKKTRRRRGGKWSLKYKRSINCRHPKGFSQRQHCKYGRRKMKTVKSIKH